MTVLKQFATSPGNIVIAGAGIAGSAAAIELLARGFRVKLLARPERSAQPVVEALGEHTVRLLAEIGCVSVLKQAAAVATRGFENGWQDAAKPTFIDGIRVHVERHTLAEAMRDEAVRRGARLELIERLEIRPTSALEAGGCTWWAALDATGRSARWSRPVQRAGRATATLYTGPGSADARPGRIVRIDERSWAYRIDHPTISTIGVIGESAQSGRLPGRVVELLDVKAPDRFTTIGHRTAYVQWTREPFQGRLLAIGDAAFACAPLAGQGVRFSLASALAAAATFRCLREGADAALAADYYRGFVHDARRRHMDMLERLRGGTFIEQPLFSLDRLHVRVTARVCMTTLLHQGNLVRSAAFRMVDGGCVRWIGSFDLLQLAELARICLPATDLAARLVLSGLNPQQADSLIRWCLQHRILAPIRPASSIPMR
ncbi:NAD(P)/FAD-dependent oxidoreductase [Paraburkholderia sediminicola]|uniref:NAD(P)/FAD-dependent oxidoreductase n=1 Tax=Paraburkholderia sediminicola TaxID=458836 RepID=UPI0038B815CB